MVKYVVGALIVLALLRLIKASMKLIITLAVLALIGFLLIQFGALGALGL